MATVLAFIVATINTLLVNVPMQFAVTIVVFFLIGLLVFGVGTLMYWAMWALNMRSRNFAAS
jgi:hypothetical protein